MISIIGKLTLIVMVALLNPKAVEVDYTFPDDRIIKSNTCEVIETVKLGEAYSIETVDLKIRVKFLSLPSGEKVVLGSRYQIISKANKNIAIATIEGRYIRVISLVDDTQALEKISKNLLEPELIREKGVVLLRCAMTMEKQNITFNFEKE